MKTTAKNLYNSPSCLTEVRIRKSIDKIMYKHLYKQFMNGQQEIIGIFWNEICVKLAALFCSVWFYLVSFFLVHLTRSACICFCPLTLFIDPSVAWYGLSSGFGHELSKVLHLCTDTVHFGLWLWLAAWTDKDKRQSGSFEKSPHATNLLRLISKTNFD